MHSTYPLSSVVVYISMDVCEHHKLVCDYERIGMGGRRNPQVFLWPYVFQLSIIYQFEKGAVFVGVLVLVQRDE